MKLVSLLAMAAMVTAGAVLPQAPAQAAAAIGIVHLKVPPPGRISKTYQPPKVCGVGVGHLPDLTGMDIFSITEGRNIHVQLLCPGIADDRDVAGSIQHGNVRGLKGLIDANRVIRGKLFDDGFQPADVVAIVPTPNHGAWVYVEESGS